MDLKTAQKNVQVRKSDSKIRELRGTVVSNVSDLQDLHFLTSEGVYFRILKNTKYHQLLLMSGESLKVLAYVHDLDQHVHTLDIVTFDLDFTEDTLAEDEKIDDIVYSVPEDTFIDYESFNS